MSIMPLANSIWTQAPAPRLARQPLFRATRLDRQARRLVLVNVPTVTTVALHRQLVIGTTHGRKLCLLLLRPDEKLTCKVCTIIDYSDQVGLFTAVFVGCSFGFKSAVKWR